MDLCCHPNLFFILVTGRLPDALANLRCLIIRYGNRT
jgi:hypothetical protein